MFERLVDDRVLIMARLAVYEVFEEMCRCHMTLDLTTYRFHGLGKFVAKQLERNKIIHSPDESQSLKIEEFLVQL